MQVAMAKAKIQAIYSNGGYSLVPLVAGYIVKSQDGNIVLRFSLAQLEMGIESVDELAEMSGQMAHCQA